MTIQFERCNQDKYPNEPGKCKTKEQIDDWIIRKFFVLVENEELFYKTETKKENRI